MQGILVENIYKSFGKEAVLVDASLQIPEGTICGIVGNNGSGKTVLMKCITGFIRPDRGRVTVDGAVIGRDRDFPESIGIIIETPGFLPNVSGYGNLRTLAAMKGIIGKKEILDTLRRVGLKAAGRKRVAKYSLGMRQRLGIAQAIMENPNNLILDEPFNGLDKTGASEMRELLYELKGQGKSMLLASHNALDIEELCDMVYEIEIGKPLVRIV